VKKVAFYTLGCKLNFSETSTIARCFEEQGYQRVDFHDAPDIFVINTCSVTENANKKCRKIVREAQSVSPEGFIIIIGCYAQLKPEEIAEISGVDAVLGASEKFRLLEVIKSFEKREKPAVYACDIDDIIEFNAAYSLNDRTRTFLKIQDGCDYHCTFCTIPLARGKSRSTTIKEIVSKAHEIGQRGVKEIVLTGVNTGDVGIIGGHRNYRFLDLIRELDQIDLIKRFRISSIEPNLLSDEIIDFVAHSKRFVPHFHLPLQSGSDKVLGLMKRRYRVSLFQSRIDQIQRYLPIAGIGVDVIVGFPGEKEQDFQETFHFLNDLQISYLHVFTYSERPNTLAASMRDEVPLHIRHMRARMLRNLSLKKQHAFYQDNIGKKALVLFENDIKDGRIYGFTQNYIRVSTDYQESLINKVVQVDLKKFVSDHISAKLIRTADLILA